MFFPLLPAAQKPRQLPHSASGLERQSVSLPLPDLRWSGHNTNPITVNESGYCCQTWLPTFKQNFFKLGERRRQACLSLVADRSSVQLTATQTGDYTHSDYFSPKNSWHTHINSVKNYKIWGHNQPTIFKRVYKAAPGGRPLFFSFSILLFFLLLCVCRFPRQYLASALHSRKRVRGLPG